MKKSFLLLFTICLLSLSLTLFAACKGDKEGATLQLDRTEMMLQVGDSQTLKATFKEGSSFRWTSSDEDVAAVDIGGRVVGVSVGNAVITVSSEDQTSQCRVTVKDRAQTSDKIIIITQSEVKIDVNDKTTQLQAITFNLGEVAWSSSNESVVKVDSKSGVLMPISTGEAVVTATSDGKSATCKVTVYEKPTLIVENLDSYIFAGDTVPLNVQFKVDGANGDLSLIEWTSSNDEVVSVENGTLTAKACGTSKIVASYEGVSSEISCEVRMAIRTAEDFLSIKDAPRDASNNITYKYVLLNDLDLNGAVVNAFAPYKSEADTNKFTKYVFNGEFDGRGHAISNFSVYDASGLSSVFGLVGAEGVIKNTSFMQVKGSDETVQPQIKFKGVVALVNLGTIENCFVELNVSSTFGANANNPIGAFVFDNRGLLSHCIARMTIAKNEKVDISLIGALVGKHIRAGASVEHCFVLVEYPDPLEMKLTGQTTVQPVIINSSHCYDLNSFLAFDFSDYDRNLWSFESGKMPSLINQ